jgi:hypothetical protein
MLDPDPYKINPDPQPWIKLINSAAIKKNPDENLLDGKVGSVCMLVSCSGHISHAAGPLQYAALTDSCYTKLKFTRIPAQISTAI